jgi:exodeoxyribonuclease-3
MTTGRMKLISWNVNGLRSVLQKGLRETMEAAKADVFCLQEIKCHPGDVQDVRWPLSYAPVWNPAEKRGYAGTAMFLRKKPLKVTYGIGASMHDAEGRVITAEFPDWWLVTVYTPNSQRGLARLNYRVQSWDPAFRQYLKKLEKKKPVVFCGDLNVAHTELDLTNPKTNRRNAGFSDEERQSFSELLAAGFIDTFREFEKDGGHYTWWSQMSDCRARNIGWRVDYFGISAALRPRLKKAWISPEVTGSDHCPIGIEID